LAKQIEQAVQELPLIYREVFVLRDQNELSTEEVAQALGLSTSLVKVRLHRARMLLQKRLAPYLEQAVSMCRQWWHFIGGRI